MNFVFDRRNLLIGAGCVAAIGAAEALKPRRQMLLLSQANKLADIIPRTAGAWVSQDVSDLVAPRETNSLASRLYGQTVGRLYSEPQSSTGVMLLAAYGETQSRDLQVHRPENCYPALGFSIRQTAERMIPVAPGVQIPGRRVLAEAPGRQEAILYWTRLGEYLPKNGAEQRLDVLKIAFSGFFADGLLFRLSAVGPSPEASFALLDRFASELLTHTPGTALPVLIGHDLARSVTRSAGENGTTA
jgi:EpsI family protein